MSVKAGPAFITNVVYDFRSGKPLYFTSSDNRLVGGRLLELGRIGQPMRRMRAFNASPLLAYLIDLDTQRNTRGAGRIDRDMALFQSDEAPAAPLLLVAAPGDTATQPIQPPPSPQSAIPNPQSEAPPKPEIPKKYKFDIQGFRYLKYRDYTSSGNSGSFMARSGLTLYGDKFEQGSNLKFTAKSTNRDLGISGTINELPFQERQLDFTIDAGPYEVKLGDFASTFKGGALAELNKKITGAQVLYESKKYEFGFVTSQAKSETKTISFNGDNTHGPYDMRTFEVLSGSVTVKLNGQTLAPDSYDIDYYAGLVNFCSAAVPPKCTNIKTSDTVQVVYEQKMLLALKGGNIQGFKAAYKLGEKGGIGTAFLTQDANRAAQRIRKYKSETFSGAALPSQTIQLATTSAKYPGLVFMARNTETVERNGQPLTRDTDYFFATDTSGREAGYGFGRILLAAPPAASDNYTVSFTYYVDDFINFSPEENIIDTGAGSNIYPLSHATVYSGLETVLYCLSTDCSGAPPLIKGVDYTMDESLNSIVTLSSNRPNAAAGAFLRVKYYYVPADAPKSSEFAHTVRNIYGNAALGKNLKLIFEYATSNNDVARTPIQILNEIVLTASAAYACPTTGTPPEPCIALLDNANLEPDSELLRFHTSATALRRGVDYIIDPNTGRIMFTGSLEIPAGTVIYASYRYNPDINIGLTTGNAFRLKGTSRLRNVAITFNREDTDPFFAPIGGNNTLETRRREYTLSAPLAYGISLQTSHSSFENAQDIFERFVTSTRQNDTIISYEGEKILKSLTWSFGKTSANDNRDTHATDNTRGRDALDLTLTVPRFRNMSLKLNRATDKFSDKTSATDNTSARSLGWTLSYRPRPALSLDFQTKTETVDAAGVSAPYRSSNTARNILLSYQPIPLITLSASIDAQRQADSRPTMAPAGVDTSTIRLTTMPFWLVRVFSYSLTQQDRPSQFTGGTQSDMSNWTFTFVPARGLSITPALSISKFSASGTSNKTSLRNVRLEYIPAEKKYETSYTKEWSQSDTASASGGDSTSKANRLTWDFKYKLKPATSLVYRFAKNNTTFSASSAETGDVRDTFQIIHEVSGKILLSANFSKYRQTGVFLSQENIFELHSKYYFSKTLFWDTTYKITKYATPEKPENNFKGKILETELRLEF